MKVLEKVKAWIARPDREAAERQAGTHPPDQPASSHERPPGMRVQPKVGH